MRRPSPSRFSPVARCPGISRCPSTTSPHSPASRTAATSVRANNFRSQLWLDSVRGVAASGIAYQVQVDVVDDLRVLDIAPFLTMPTMTTLRSAIRSVFSLCSAVTMDCSTPSTSVDASVLNELPKSDKTCRETRQDSARASRGFVRTLDLETSSAPRRIVSVSVDSLNHPRLFSAVVTVSKRENNTAKSQMVTATFDATGHISQALREFRTMELPSGAGDSKRVVLSDADTARVRALTVELLHRCVQ